MLQLIDIDKSFATRNGALKVLEHITMTCAAGEFVSIIGPSGCGKSTLLNLLAGLDKPDSGMMYLNGVEVTGQRGLVAYMPQRDALLPWRTVVENATLAAEVQRQDVAAARREARDMLDIFGLEGFGDVLPSSLSGGMRQRAALLRTVLWHRPVMLLDEPFGALDAITRTHLQQWLLDLWEQLDHTIMLVTHDIEEALLLSDRIYVLAPRPGRVVQEVAVSLPRPRAFRMTTSVEFARLKQQVREALGGG